MGIVNNYISKIIDKINKLKNNEEKPWLKYYDRMPEHLNYYNGSMYDIVNDASLKYPNNIALEFFDIKYTFKQMINKIDTVAVALKNLNIVENECVTICMPNMPEAIFLIYAVNKIGAICNIIHPLSSEDEIRKSIEETDSNVIFATDVSYKKVENIKLKNIIICEVSNSMNSFMQMAYNLKNRNNMKYNENVIKWHDFIKLGNEVMNTHVSRGKDSPAIIIYSGGTTGRQKGIVLSNLCFNSLVTQCEAVCKEAKAGNSILSALPIFHGFGLCICIHVPLSLGLKCILVPKINTLKINHLIKSKKPNLLPVIPSMLNIIVNSLPLGKNSFKSVKVILSGGDYLDDKLRSKVENYFRKCGSIAHIQIGYGLSEATAFVSATSESVKDTNNIGIPNPDNIIKIFEPGTDIELGYDNTGEICVSGPSLMLGYINQDKETEDVLKIHYDGKTWLHTGDLGYMRSDGVLHYQSRLKRMIISNGYNIYPIELEEVIKKHEAVKDCVVVAVKHKIKSEVPKAVIVLKNDVEKTDKLEKEIKDYCKKNIAKYAVPYEYEFRNNLPVTKVGKIDYKQFEKK